MSSAATYRLLAAIDEFQRAFPEDHGDIKARLGEIEKQVSGEVLVRDEGGEASPGQQASAAAARGDAERMSARRPAQRSTEGQPKSFQEARQAAENRFQEAAAPAGEPAPAGPSA